MNTTALSPCPFCGKAAMDQWPNETLDASGDNCVRCAWCHGAAPMNTWNRRALTQQPAASEGDGLARIHAMFRMLGLDRIEELPGWGWCYNRNTCSVEGMIENGTLIEHFDDWVGFRPSDNTSKQADGAT